jgi:hypothetical protein
VSVLARPGARHGDAAGVWLAHISITFPSMDIQHCVNHYNV